MTASTQPDPVAIDLVAINRELAALLHTDAADLPLGAPDPFGDDLVVCGILGGKDVGKSTLINALAQTNVSDASQEVGEGTARPMVYVHEDVREAAAHRLRDLDNSVPIDVTLHRADAIRNVVLVDLPDFDSEFETHLDVVRAVAPRLDRVLWVLTPRKLGDRAWIQMLPRVIKDPENVHWVLNKIDELLADADPFEQTADQSNCAGASIAQRSTTESHAGNGSAEAFWRAQRRWLTDSVSAAGCNDTDDHCFLIAGRFPAEGAFTERIAQLWDDTDWQRYGRDRAAVEQVAALATAELARLRECVLGRVSVHHARAIKEANRRREIAVSIDCIRDHYELDRLLDRLKAACDPAYHQRALNDAVGPTYCIDVAEGLKARLRPDNELADDLLERRVEPWPLLRLAHWPFGWLSRMLGRRFASRFRIGTGGEPWRGHDDPFRIAGRTLADRVGLLDSRIRADHALVVRRLHLDAEFPSAQRLVENVTAAARTIAPRLEERLLAGIRATDRKPGFLRRLSLWAILLWFPFVQPIADGVLGIVAMEGTLDVARGLHKVVAALGAINLLSGFAVVAAVYVAILAGMYARALSAVRRARIADTEGAPLVEAVDDLLITHIVAPMVQPFQEKLARLDALDARLHAKSTTTM
ncbi:MAG: hypothetical protein IID36_06395, partial [Planctomycetes bacterium]|nr:hypothetical protein [Planctomycetota bacterium]